MTEGDLQRAREMGKRANLRQLCSRCKLSFQAADLCAKCGVGTPVDQLQRDGICPYCLIGQELPPSIDVEYAAELRDDALCDKCHLDLVGEGVVEVRQ